MEDWLEPLHDATTMRAIDAWAIEERGVPSLELMETAGRAVAATAERIAGAGPIRVVCGKGNNGGDGLVAARHLSAAGHRVETLLLWPAGELQGDSRANLERHAGPVRELAAGEAAAALAGSGVVIDAIFGTGFGGAPRDPARTAIEAINAARVPVVAVDVASGVDASTGEVHGAAVEATATVSFHAAKLGHWVAPGKRHRGELEVVPIGIPAGAPARAPAGLITGSVVELLAPRGPESTKFSSGQVVVVGGSRGLTGAVCMAAAAAGRAGAGYVTVAVPGELEPIFETKLTEVMSVGCASASGSFAGEAADAIVEAAARAAAVVLGPGIGRGEATAPLVAELLGRIEAPVVLDADGLNAIAGRPELAARSAPTVLTPHAGELGRLLGVESAEVGARRLTHATAAAERADAVVVLKGDDTIVASPPPERPVVNGLSAPALATAGTGDVLSGMIAAAIARGLEPRVAAAAAVHAHTRAGRVAAERVGAAESVVAPDVIDAIAAGLRREPG